MINLMLIGIGPHSKRVYLPAVKKLKATYDIELRVAVDLIDNQQEVQHHFEQVKLFPEFLFVCPFVTSIPSQIREQLDSLILKHDITGVIIATDPLVHKPYAEWALDRGLHILMDKPISTHKNVTTDLHAAQAIYRDYVDLIEKYTLLQKRKHTIFSINTQRRFHAGFDIVRDSLIEVASKTNCPITGIQSMHCDGQWRLPSEIVTQNYHPYNVGYGKLSHSGYHILDTIYNLYKSSSIKNKFADSFEVFSSFVQPRGLLKQINSDDYYSYFGNEYAEVHKFKDEELWEKYSSYGEVDVNANIRLLHEGENICNVSINLLHNGFSRRNWMYPGKDLYKGNGRVKHEYHNIQQGPFQNIQIHSYQSKDKHENNTDEDYSLGGNNHFDIYIFKNTGILGGNTPIKTITMQNIAQQSGLNETTLAVEQFKFKVVEEFILFIRGEKSKNKLVSSIDDHVVPVKWLSTIYESHIRQNKVSMQL